MAEFIQGPLLSVNANAPMRLLKTLRRGHERWQRTAAIPGDPVELDGLAHARGEISAGLFSFDVSAETHWSGRILSLPLV